MALTDKQISCLPCSFQNYCKLLVCGVVAYNNGKWSWMIAAYDNFETDTIAFDKFS